MSFSNIQDYMSFFFVGKYINGENISVRNIAPSLDDKKDILSKTAKLINLSINYSLTPKNALNYVNPDNPELEASTNAFMNEFQVAIGFNSAKRRAVNVRRNNEAVNMPHYCQFKSDGVLTAKPLARLSNDFSVITDVNARKFYGSLIAGAYIGNNATLNAAYNQYYSNHMIHFFTSLAAQPFEHNKIMVFNNEGDVHKYLKDFYGFVSEYTFPIGTQTHNNALIGFSKDIHAARYNLDDFHNKDFGLILSQNKLDRWNTLNTVLILDHMDVTSYYNVANGLVLAKLNQLAKDNNYVVPQEHVNDIERFSYLARTSTGALNTNRTEKFRFVNRRYLAGVTCPSPFIYVLKMVMPRNQTVYLLMTNLESPFEAGYECKMELTFAYAQHAFNSSENFKLAANGVKAYLDKYFKTVNNER